MKKSFLLIILLVFIFLQTILISSIMLDKPGPYYDELGPVVRTVRFRKSEQIPQTYKVILGIPFQFIGGEYTGTTQNNIYYFVNHFFHHPLLYRIINVVIGGVVAVVFFFLVKMFIESSPSAYLITSAFTLSPTFVFYSRVGMHVIFIRILFSTLLFYLFLKYLSSNSFWYLLLFSFFSGWGVATRLELAWIPIATCVYFLIFRRNKIKKIVLSTRIIGLFSAFIIGLSPFLMYNYHTKLATFKRIGRNLAVTQYGHSNITFIPNLVVRLKNILSLLHGGLFAELGGSFKNYLPASVLIISLLAFLVFRLIKKRRRFEIDNFDAMGIRCLLTVVLVTLPLSTFSITGGSNPMHLLVIYPIFYLLIALFLKQAFPKKLWVIIIAFLLLAASNLISVYRYYKILNQTSGVGMFSDKIYELTNYLKENKGSRHVYYLDWGIKNNVYVLSEGEIWGEDFFGYTKTLKEDYYKWPRLLDEAEGEIIVTHAPSKTAFKGRHERLKAFLQSHSKDLILEKRIYDEGRPLFEVYTVTSKD